MPKTKISEYSTTNSANTDIESINIDEGCAPSGINNAIRELMVHLKEFQTGSSGDPLTVAGTFVASGGATLSGTNTLSGSTVMTASAGTSASPSIHFSSDTNTGIFSPAADTIAFAEGGVEAMRIDSSGNVGIGTNAPSYKLHVVGSDNLAFFRDDANTADLRITTATSQVNLLTGSGDALVFGTAVTERMRIDSSGNVGIGTTSPAVSGLEISRATGSATPTPAELRIATTTSASDWSTTSPWGRLSFYSADGSSAGPKIQATIDAIATGAGGGTSHIVFQSAADSTGTLTERMRITSAGEVLMGGTTSLVAGSGVLTIERSGTPSVLLYRNDTSVVSGEGLGAVSFYGNDTTSNTPTQLAYIQATASGTHSAGDNPTDLVFATTPDGSATVAEKMRLTEAGTLLVGTTSTLISTVGQKFRNDDTTYLVADSDSPLFINRLTNDGNLVAFYQASTLEGTISVSGTTVSYNGGHLSRWAQMLSKPTLFKGTVMSNLDEMNVYIAPTIYWTEEDELPEDVNVGDVKTETHAVDNEQLNKVKVSDVEGDVNVAGVFVNWEYDEDHQVDEINMAMTGDMIIRIAQGVVVQKGDLLMSAGDGTAKPQGDDIVRSKTVAKVTSNHVTCTYEDGSYCVPCVLMAC